MSVSGRFAAKRLLPFSLLLAFACTEPTNPSITIALSGETLTLTQGQNNTVTVTLGRADFTGSIDLAATGLPTGVTASFSPSPVPDGTTTSTITLTANSTATPGVATVAVTASGADVESKAATLALTVNVAGTYTLSASPASVTVNQGSNNATTVSVARTGGFTQPVTLAASGLPSGVTAAFSPAATEGATSTLTFTAASGATTGTSTVTVTGTTPGLANQTTTLSLTVQTPGSTTPLSIDFCADENLLWFAYQNDGGAWTRVIPNANVTVSFNATQKFAVATVSSQPGALGGTEYETFIFYLTVPAIQSQSGVACVEESGTKTLNGSVAGLGTTQFAFVSMGFNSAFVQPGQTNFSLSNLPNGALDLIGIRYAATTAEAVPDRVVVRRGLNLSSGSTIPVLDFAAAEAVALASATATLSGLSGAEDNGLITLIRTATETFTFISSTAVSGSSGTFSGVPSSLTATGDLHQLVLFGAPPTEDYFRRSGTWFRNVANQSLTLGALPSTATYTQVATTPSVRYRAQVASQADYNSAISVGFSQTNRFVTLGATANYFGGVPTTWDLTMPDLSTVSGWDNTWGLVAGQSTDLEFFVQGGTADVFGQGAEGQSFKAAGRSSSVTSAPASAAAGRSMHESRTTLELRRPRAFEVKRPLASRRK